MRAMMVSVVAAASLGMQARADFFSGQAIDVIGSALSPAGNSGWGTGFAGGGVHFLDGFNSYDEVIPSGFFVEVSSSLLGPGMLSVLIDFTDFAPDRYETHVVELNGLKFDGSIDGVSASLGSIETTGNTVTWWAAGLDLEETPIVKLDIHQVPVPGAALLLGAAALVRGRRARRHQG